MAYVNSKKYGSTVQHYKKANGDTSYSSTFQDAFDHYIEWAKGNKKSWEKDEHLFMAHLHKPKSAAA